jgi:hypothetical protein
VSLLLSYISLTRVLHHSSKPQEENGSFAKHWPAELVEEVEEVVCKHVSHLIFCLSLLLTNSMLLKFVERYERNNQQQPHTTRVCKAAVPPPKLGRWYTDDSDSSSDESDCQQATNVGNTYMEEWKLYVTDLQGPPSERTPEEKLWDFKTRAQQYARDRESCDDTRISYLEFLETEAEDDLALARMIAG